MHNEKTKREETFFLFFFPDLEDAHSEGSKDSFSISGLYENVNASLKTGIINPHIDLLLNNAQKDLSS